MIVLCRPGGGAEGGGRLLFSKILNSLYFAKETRPYIVTSWRDYCKFSMVVNIFHNCWKGCELKDVRVIMVTCWKPRLWITNIYSFPLWSWFSILHRSWVLLTVDTCASFIVYSGGRESSEKEFNLNEQRSKKRLAGGNCQRTLQSDVIDTRHQHFERSTWPGI
jgi:hypothetical protein